MSEESEIMPKGEESFLGVRKREILYSYKKRTAQRTVKINGLLCGMAHIFKVMELPIVRVYLFWLRVLWILN